MRKYLSHDGLPLAYKLVFLALISANLYLQKEKVKEDMLNKQENLMNSSKLTIKIS